MYAIGPNRITWHSPRYLQAVFALGSQNVPLNVRPQGNILRTSG